MKVYLLWSFCIIIVASAEPPIPAFGATSFLPLITLNQPEIFPPSGANPLSNTLIYQQFGGNPDGSSNSGGGLQQQPTPSSPFASNPNGGFNPQGSDNSQQQQPQQFSDSQQEESPAPSNDNTPSNEGEETANESLQQQSTNNAGQQKLVTTRFLPNQGGSFSQVVTPGFAQSPNQFGQQNPGTQQGRSQYFGPTSNSIDNNAQQQQPAQTPSQLYGPQQQQQQGQNFPTPQTGFAQQQTGLGGQQTQGFSPQQGQLQGFAPGFGGQQQQQPQGPPQGSGPVQQQGPTQPQGPVFGQGFFSQQGQGLGGQSQGQGFNQQQPQGFASQQQGVVAQQTPNFDAQQQNDAPEIQNQGLQRPFGGNQGGQQNGGFSNNPNPSSSSNIGQQGGNQANNLGPTGFQGQQNPQPAFPNQQNPQPTFPNQQNPQPAFSNQQNPQTAFPGQQNPQPAFPNQQNPQPAFPNQQNPQTAFPGQQNPQPAFPNQQNPQPAFPGQQNPQPVFPGQQNSQSGAFSPQNPNQIQGQTPGQNVGQAQGVNPGLAGRNPPVGSPRPVPNGGTTPQQQQVTPRGNQVAGNQGQAGVFPTDNVVKGQYRVGLPDGRMQIVRYIALVTYTDNNDTTATSRNRPLGSASNKRGILASLDGQTIEDDSSEINFSQKRKRSDFQEVSVPLKSPFGLRLAKIIKRRLKLAEKEKHKET